MLSILLDSPPLSSKHCASSSFSLWVNQHCALNTTTDLHAAWGTMGATLLPGTHSSLKSKVPHYFGFHSLLVTSNLVPVDLLVPLHLLKLSTFE